MSEQAVEIVADAAPVIIPDADNDAPEVTFESIASEMGWSPKEKWRGDPDKWSDAPTFIKNTPKVLAAAKEQLARSTRVATAAVEKVRSEAIEQARAEVRAAAAAGDEEAAAVAADNLIRAQAKPDPAVATFVAANPWFETDDAARNVAIAISNKLEQSGASVTEQLEAAEKEVRKRFPEHFNDEPEAKPQGKAPPAVEGGQRTAQPSARKKGWNDLPRDVQRSVTPKTLKDWGLTSDEYAESYFKENA